MTREIEDPPEIELPITDTLGGLPARNPEIMPSRPLYAVRTADGWANVAANRFNDQVGVVAKGIVARRVGAGSPVAILTPTR